MLVTDKESTQIRRIRKTGSVFNSTSRREAKRGQSTNRKGEMSPASQISKKKNLNVTTVKYILSLFVQTLSLLGQPKCLGNGDQTAFKSFPFLVVLKTTPGKSGRR